MSAQSIAKSSRITFSAQVSVTEPTFTASGTANVGDDVKVATATVTGVKLGDNIIAAPTAALTANIRFLGAYPADDSGTVNFIFGCAANAAATGAAKTFNVTVIDKTS